MSTNYPYAKPYSGNEMMEGVVEAVCVASAPPALSLTDDQKRAVLQDRQLPPGIVEQIVRSTHEFGARFWVIDNSGSMQTTDGQRFVQGAGGREGSVTASRWAELGDALQFHAELAASLGAPTEFRLLNQPPGAPSCVVCGLGNPRGELEQMGAVVQSSPLGRTPLCEHIRAVVAAVRCRERELRAAGKRALVVIASDGEPSDGDVEVALRPLKNLPAWVVIRLCTDDMQVVNFWNHVDEDLELDMDVLDDLRGEALEVTKANNFITYASPLHRLREWGCTHKVFDVLDEKKLAPPEVAQLISLILGVFDSPHPELDPEGFLKAVLAAQSRVELVWDPLRNRRVPWFDLAKLKKHIQHSGKGVCLLS